MSRIFLGTVVFLLCSSSLFASKTDPRLATLTTITVVAADQLESDRPVAVCLATHLPTSLPLTVVETDAPILRVTSRIYGDTSRKITAILAGQDAVSLGVVTVEILIDGVVIWRGGDLVSAGNKQKRTVEDDQCSLADAGIDLLRKAMKKARDKK